MSRYGLIGCLLLVLGLGQPALAAQSPLELVKQTSDQVLELVKERKEELNASPDKIYKMVSHVVLPHFDFERMSRLVLGKSWRKASDSQKEAFIREFREMLVRTYGVALLNYSGQEIKYLPMRELGDSKEVSVNTEVYENGAPPIPIKYRLYRQGEEWKVFDISIDGVSLVSNYRTGFNNQIRRYGLDGLISKLGKRNAKGKE